MEDYTMTVTQDVEYIGVNDHQIDLFEGHYAVPNGMAYNSYVIHDEKIAVMDTVDQYFTHDWMANLRSALNGAKPDYLVVHHMEPDHSANFDAFLGEYPDTQVVASDKAFKMVDQFFPGLLPKDQRIVVKEGDVLDLGKHQLHFVAAPMVHWPEVMFSYDSTDKILFSADAFGKFGANNVEQEWTDEARRYYIGIVGKYGMQVQNVLKKAAKLDIRMICSLHGPILKGDLSKYLNLYDTWSAYRTESDGVLIAYTSIYGHTKKAVELLAKKLREKGCPKVVVDDLARTDMAACVGHAFQYGKIVLATTTYNMEIFPFMREFINCLTERNFQNRQIAFIENGSWAPQAMKVMQGMLSKSKNLTYCENNVKIFSAMSDANRATIDALAAELVGDDAVAVESPDERAAAEAAAAEASAPKAAASAAPAEAPAAEAPASDAAAEPRYGWVCKICGYIYEGDPLPDDFICPVCGRPASDFERIELD